MKVVIKQPNKPDIPSLVQLNKEFQFNSDNSQLLETGFLLNAAFSANDFEAIINREEILIAVIENKIIGYYLIDSCTQTSNLKDSNALIRRFISNGLISDKIKIAPRAQVVVKKEFQNQGSYKKLLKEMSVLICTNYQAIFGMVAKENPKIKVHLNVGWNIITEDSRWYYLLYQLK